MPSSRARVGDLVRRPRPAELFERDAEVHDLDLRGVDLARADHEVGGALRDGERDVGERLERPVGDLLEPGGRGQVGVLVQDGRNAPDGARHPAERRRAVAMKVQDVDPLAIDDLQQRRQRQRIELAALEVGDVDAQLLERFLGEVFLAQADERDAEPLAVEARNHPAEQPLDAVHPRSLPAEVIADLQDVQRALADFRHRG